MKIGITGLPQGGKTTIYNALTGQHADTGAYYHKGGGTDRHISVIKVPDARLDNLERLVNPKKKTNATIELHDFAGLVKKDGGKEISSREYLDVMSKVDVLMVVIRAFESELVIHPEGSLDPLRDMDTFATEILLRDLEIIEQRLMRLKRLPNKKDNLEENREIKLLERCKTSLESEIPLRNCDFTGEEDKMIKGFQFLTYKRILIVLNIGEDEIRKGDRSPELFKDYLTEGTALCASICGSIEQEISELDENDAKEFMGDYGIEEPAAAKIIRLCYDLTGLITFFTAGEKEVRAWPITSGLKAPQAAGTIHTDFERGFIRAEVIDFRHYIENKSESACKEKGLMRLEGKDYIVKDSDVILFRFNV